MGYLPRTIILFLITFTAKAQIPAPALAGYFHNWSSVNAPYIPLNQVDARYNVIDVAFALPIAGTDYRMNFTPDQGTAAAFISQMQTLQSAGKKIIISIGGATAPITLSSGLERDSFAASMTRIILNYGFDGIDIDLEGSSLTLTGGTIANPVDAPLIRMRDAIQTIMANYRNATGKKLLLTFAPETAFVQGGQSGFGGIWGAYLPLLDALRDSIDLLHVQLYNSGSMYGIDGQIYTQGTADFIVAMTEAVIQGFSTQGGFFAGFPPEKVAVGLPSCSLAAGSGYADTVTVAAAMNYLLGKGPKPGSYTLTNVNAYPNLAGMMTWSINWDANSTCNGSYAFAENFGNIYLNVTAMPEDLLALSDAPVLYPNPNQGSFILRIPSSMKNTAYFRLYDINGRMVAESKLEDASEYQLTTPGLQPGSYIWRVEDFSGTMMVE